MYVHVYKRCIIHTPLRMIYVQLTWVPNELEGFDVAVFECPERLCEPRGWLYKLWEVLCPKGLAVFCSSSWDREQLLGYTGKWCVRDLTHTHTHT